ncbi:MAG: type III secretion system export apparatus subunit SctS [Oleiphilaceae bacterium]|nr:type III secretion system export apparatus subunit SctS [Oleiphilaceae bacterium]
MFELLSLFEKALVLVVVLTAPPILAAVISGMLVSVLQSLFQIQDQTLPFAIKLLSVGIALYLTGRWIGVELLNLSNLSLQAIPGF